MKKKLSVVVVSITPFTQAGQLDEAAFRRQLGRLREAGVSVYVGGSGSGEGYTLTPAELERVLAISVEELKGKVPVRAMGGEPRSTAEMVNLVKAAEVAGVDAGQIFSLDIGHAIKPTYAEMERYYSTVIESTSLPVYLSSHYSVGYFLPIDLIEKLVSRYPQIAGIAYGGPDVPYIGELIRGVGESIEVHCAGPANALSVLGLGGNGFMGAEGNFAPHMVAEVIRSYEKQDLEAIRASFDKLMAFATLYVRFGGGHSMRGLKPLMNVFGLPGGHLRAPRLPICDSDAQAMAKLVAALNLPGIPALPASRAEKALPLGL